MAKAISMKIGIPGVEVWIEYQASNLRIRSFEWTIPESGVVVRGRIWDSDSAEPEVPIFDRTVGGPNTGTQTVPGSYRMVEVTEGDETFYDLPPNILYSINIETIG